MSRSFSSSSASTTNEQSTLNSFFLTSAQQNRLNNNNHNNNNRNDHRDQDDDDEEQYEEEEEHPSVISAEIIREAVKNLDKKGNLADYQRRIAIRELKDLIQRSTERNSVLLPNEKQNEATYEELKKSLTTQQQQQKPNSSSSSSGDEFTSLRQKLGKILAETEQNEKDAAQMASLIQNQFWPTMSSGFVYTPIDLLDIMVLSGGTSCASSDMTMDSLRILFQLWKTFREDNPTTALNSSSSSTLMIMTDNELELTAQWMNCLNSFCVPRKIQNQLFTQIKDLPPKVRALRLMFGIARANSAFPARERFVEKFRNVAAQLRGPIQMIKKEFDFFSKMEDQNAAKQKRREILRWSPPELLELAEDLLPRIKAFEIAVGFPFFLDKNLVEEAGLNIFGIEAEEEEKRGDLAEAGVTAMLNKIIQESDKNDF
jgi:hypothetical protein